MQVARSVFQGQLLWLCLFEGVSWIDFLASYRHSGVPVRPSAKFIHLTVLSLVI
jgi:hypothetical protein